MKCIAAILASMACVACGSAEVTEPIMIDAEVDELMITDEMSYGGATCGVSFAEQVGVVEITCDCPEVWEALRNTFELAGAIAAVHVYESMCGPIRYELTGEGE